MNPTVLASIISSATTLTGVIITTRRQTKTLKTHVTDTAAGTTTEAPNQKTETRP